MRVKNEEKNKRGQNKKKKEEKGEDSIDYDQQHVAWTDSAVGVDSVSRRGGEVEIKSEGTLCRQPIFHQPNAPGIIFCADGNCLGF